MLSAIILLGTLCIFFGILTFIVCRNPRPFRRFYQEIFETDRKQSVNRNKRIDEHFQKKGPKYAIPMFFVGTLFLFAALFIRSHFLPSREELLEEKQAMESISNDLKSTEEALKHQSSVEEEL